MSEPRHRARKCFALAARAGTPGERDAAMARGMAIVERYKLDPNTFDIPGRQRLNERKFDRYFRDYDFDGDDALAKAHGTSFRDFRRWSGEIDPRDVAEAARVAAEKRLREECAAAEQREAQWKARCHAHEHGRARFTVLTNDTL